MRRVVEAIAPRRLGERRAVDGERLAEPREMRPVAPRAIRHEAHGLDPRRHPRVERDPRGAGAQRHQLGPRLADASGKSTIAPPACRRSRTGEHLEVGARRPSPRFRRVLHAVDGQRGEPLRKVRIGP